MNCDYIFRDAQASDGCQPFRTQVAQVAHATFLKRGAQHGHDLSDWLNAERLVKQTAAANALTSIQSDRRVVKRGDRNRVLITVTHISSVNNSSP